jgi:hypothetical protein
MILIDEQFNQSGENVDKMKKNTIRYRRGTNLDYWVELRFPRLNPEIPSSRFQRDFLTQQYRLFSNYSASLHLVGNMLILVIPEL